MLAIIAVIVYGLFEIDYHIYRRNLKKELEIV